MMPNVVSKSKTVAHQSPSTMPVDADAFYRREKSGENRTNRWCPLNWGPNRSHKLDIFVKWRSTNIPCSKPIQVRFNSTNHIVPHEKLQFQRQLLLETPILQAASRALILHDADY